MCQAWGRGCSLSSEEELIQKSFLLKKDTTLGFLAWEASEEMEVLSKSFMGREEDVSENVPSRGGGCGKA